MAMKLFVFALCVYLVTGQITQNCDTLCDDESPLQQTVCGTDGVTYSSTCEFNNAMCNARKQGKVLYMQNSGDCVTENTPCDQVMKTRCNNVYINPGMINPILTGGGAVIGGTTLNSDTSSQVCGSDGHTYNGMCVFMHTVCSHRMSASSNQLSLDHTGPCNGVATNGSRTVDCSPYIVDNSGLALETDMQLTVDNRMCQTDTRHYVCYAGRTFGNVCQFCSYMAQTHQITSKQLSAQITSDGICSHIGIIG